MTIKAQSVYSAMYGWKPPQRPQGAFRFVHRRADGTLVEVRDVPNLIVNAGLAALAGLLHATGHTNAFDYIAIGIGTTAPVGANTTLQSEITTGGGARALATLSRVTTTETNDTARLVKTFTFTASFAVTEAGVFDSAAAGTMLCRQTFTAITVVNTDTLAITYDIAGVPS